MSASTALDEWIQGSEAEEEYEPNAQPYFFPPDSVFPFLSRLACRSQEICAEAERLENMLRFTPWPEGELYNQKDQSGDWKVVPLLYTFPATDPGASVWVEANCQQCPLTASLLKGIPGIRTALFSRMGPRTRLSAHRGWADLANHVLRCHLPLRVPTDAPDCCGVWVEGHVKHHRQGEVIVFDDSRAHKAYNASHAQDRVVLIFDIARPAGVPLGTAVDGHTDQLDAFIGDFERKMAYIV
jgi:aspartyl/asparaginyl beta-hydroxylase (cupin superfamily)